jgi:transcription elongation factor Elf1
MSALIYPLHFHRQFERRWLSKAANDQNRRSPPRGQDTCTVCGHVVTAPSTSTHLQTGKIVNHWRCSACGNAWDTFVESPVRKVARSSPIGIREARNGQIEPGLEPGDDV